VAAPIAASHSPESPVFKVSSNLRYGASKRRLYLAKSLNIALMILLAAQAGALFAQDAATEEPIRAIVAEQVVAWNAGHAQAYARHFAPDVSFTNIFGMVMYGATAFVKRNSEILNTFYKGTTKQQTIRRIRFVTADVAIVDIDNEVRGVKAMPGGINLPPDGVVKTQLMQVFVRREGRWWIEAFHNVEIKPAK